MPDQGFRNILHGIYGQSTGKLTVVARLCCVLCIGQTCGIFNLEISGPSFLGLTIQLFSHVNIIVDLKQLPILDYSSRGRQSCWAAIVRTNHGWRNIPIPATRKLALLWPLNTLSPIPRPSSRLQEADLYERYDEPRQLQDTKKGPPGTASNPHRPNHTTAIERLQLLTCDNLASIF